MNPQNISSPQPQSSIHNPLAVMQPGEQVVCEIRRHPIGIFLIYGACGIVVILLALMTFVGLPSLFGEGSSIMVLTGIVFVIMTVLALLFALVSTIVYWGNSWVVTSDSITQISHTSIFHKQSSQLSLGDLEDITTEKHGILTHLFNYGTLKAETAGERSKFMFIYCPNPNYYAQKILAAREQFERGEEGHAAPAAPVAQPMAPPPQPTVAPAYQPPQPQPQPETPTAQPPAAPQQPYTTAPQSPPPYAPPVAQQPAYGEQPQPNFPSVDQAAHAPANDQLPPSA